MICPAEKVAHPPLPYGLPYGVMYGEPLELRYLMGSIADGPGQITLRESTPRGDRLPICSKGTMLGQRSMEAWVTA